MRDLSVGGAESEPGTEGSVAVPSQDVGVERKERSSFLSSTSTAESPRDLIAFPILWYGLGPLPSLFISNDPLPPYLSRSETHQEQPMLLETTRIHPPIEIPALKRKRQTQRCLEVRCHSKDVLIRHGFLSVLIFRFKHQLMHTLCFTPVTYADSIPHLARLAPESQA